MAPAGVSWADDSMQRFHLHAVTVRSIDGGWEARGPGAAWIHLDVDLVDGEDTSPLCRFVTVAARRVESDAVEDLVQDALRIVHEKAGVGPGTLVDGRPALAWCFQVLRNVIGNHYQRRRSAESVAVEDQPLADGDATPLERLEAALAAARQCDPHQPQQTEQLLTGLDQGLAKTRLRLDLVEQVMGQGEHGDGPEDR